MINFFTLFYTLILLILNPITLNLIFHNKMYGQIFTPALIIFDLVIFLLAYLTFKNKNKLDSIIVFFSFIILMVICEVAAGKFMYGKKNSFDVIFKEPVFFDDEKQNFRQKYYKCALKKADYYHKLYFFSAPKNLDCGGWSTIKSKNGPWVRNTINFSGQSNENNIWFFGGSTMYNGALSDKDTIPSLVSKKLNLSDKNFYVENFGIGGLDLHYEVNNFFNLLRFSKNKPEIVVFYDGYNDIFNKLRHGGEFFIFNFSQSLMYDQNNFYKSVYFFSEFVSDYSVIYKNTLGKKIKKFNIERLRQNKKKFSVQEISEDFINSIKFANDLAKNHKIDVYFFLQPAPFSRKNPVGIEALHHKTEEANFAREIYEKISTNIDLRNFYDISNIFDNYSEQFFYDYAHLSRKGNLVISEKIFEILNRNINQ